jgi:hypothetical protein
MPQRNQEKIEKKLSGFMSAIIGQETVDDVEEYLIKKYECRDEPVFQKPRGRYGLVLNSEYINY